MGVDLLQGRSVTLQREDWEGGERGKGEEKFLKSPNKQGHVSLIIITIQFFLKKNMSYLS